MFDSARNWAHSKEQMQRKIPAHDPSTEMLSTARNRIEML